MNAELSVSVLVDTGARLRHSCPLRREDGREATQV
jgi:hypothetical protein